MGSTDDDASERRSIGPHLVWIEPPDVLHTRIDGDITREHVKELLDALGTFPRAERIYILRDARGGGMPTREAREALIKGLPLDRLAAVVSYGASFQARTLLTMLDHAMRVLRPGKTRFVFFETEAEARAFLEADRTRRA
ncbi:STAS/SEC14 domain-containing protein [Polyangium sorediatum]|uniref:STAS/SEC14 domain-containing protein n=1 Tax=Polyangium sorediatum TaxID=889274 RepID=A0ABT6NRW3_9BACT|nr:STAS/SEC14 domain-containing protein [Polyangium sorediatum]MDI1431081.1 STAS/SEC14 domain-containing protein [Polyangium sorediatum]